MARYLSQGVFLLDTPVKIESYAAVVGEKEGKGPLAECFDEIINDSHFGQIIYAHICYFTDTTTYYCRFSVA